MGIVCARIGCNRKKEYGLFCVEHKPVPANPVRVVCAARGCNLSRDGRTLFCGSHQRAMDRDCQSYLSIPPVVAEKVGGFRTWAELTKVEPKERPKPVIKAVVKWRADLGRYLATHQEYWNGLGYSPGEALLDMRPVDDLPF